MRTVICHFYNEAYLLPWWLNHHKKIFDHGIMINHKSTDLSVEIIKSITPNWDIFETQLSEFDAFMTDLEVMNYEKDVKGFKIALNVTEFLMSTIPMEEIDRALLATGRVGCVTSGIICVDHNPAVSPLYERPLQVQKHWGYDDNLIFDQTIRIENGQTLFPFRNRFYHSDKVGMYHPGRHFSWHQDSTFRVGELMVFHFGYAPWNQHFLKRKLQIKEKTTSGDLKRKWGSQHLLSSEELDVEFSKQEKLSIDLNNHELASKALKLWG